MARRSKEIRFLDLSVGMKFLIIISLALGIASYLICGLSTLKINDINEELKDVPHKYCHNETIDEVISPPQFIVGKDRYNCNQYVNGTQVCIHRYIEEVCEIR